MNLSERDLQYNWHPYTQHKTAAPHIAITKGEGALLWDENGKEYIDAIASWWVNPFGHSNKVMAEAIYKIIQTPSPKGHYKIGAFMQKFSIVLKKPTLKNDSIPLINCPFRLKSAP